MWKELEPYEGDALRHYALGPLHLWIQRKHEEVWIAHGYEQDLDGSEDPADGPPETMSWSRWAFKSPGQTITFTPAFPDLPIVVSSEFPLKISPGSKIQIFTRITIWIRIAFEKSDYLITEIPVVKLSKTWFGTPLEGELCYWLTTKARRDLSQVEKKPYVVNCPIWITNKASEDLNFEKFCFRVERLGIHRAEDELWAGETQIVYHGEELNSDITMTGKLPSNLSKGVLLSKPRNPLQKSLATRTFKKLFDDTFISAR